MKFQLSVDKYRKQLFLHQLFPIHWFNLLILIMQIFDINVVYLHLFYIFSGIFLSFLTAPCFHLLW